MAAINMLSDRQLVARRFPRSRNHIHGRGYYGLLIKCRAFWSHKTPWRVFLYETRETRDQARQVYSCPSGCFGLSGHETFELGPSPVKYKQEAENAMLKGTIWETR